MRSILSIVLLCCIVSAQAAIPPPPKTHHHPFRWMKQHPALTGMAIAGAVVLPIVLMKQRSCPSYVDGIPYNGTPPCPKSCEGMGDCYWGPKK